MVVARVGMWGKQDGLRTKGKSAGGQWAVGRDSGVPHVAHCLPSPNSPRCPLPMASPSPFPPSPRPHWPRVQPTQLCLGLGPVSQGHADPLVPTAGDGDVTQVVTDSLGDSVGFVCVVICGDAELVQSPGVDSQHVGDEPAAPVLGQGGPHPDLSRLVHQGPGRRGPLRPQQAEGGEGPDTALDESLAPLIATKMPEFIHQSSMCRIHG